MLGEAAAMGRSLFIFDVGDGDTPWWRLSHSYRYKPLSHRLAMRLAPRRMRRDIGNIQGALIATGGAAWLEPAMIDTAAAGLKALYPAVPGSGASAPVAVDEELRRAAQAVRQLLTAR
jgi:hypothetical protein